ncbi:MAG TPA: hypothetical protein VHL80_12520 [Polyangia bacterium]|nr:hypothetical protein [Polyangia bacterium]
MNATRHRAGGSVGKRGGQKLAGARLDEALRERDERTEMQTASSRARGERERAGRPEGAHAGADVAPTKRAEAREKERHRLERKLGRTPAGEAGLVREHRAAGVSREALAEAARRADRRVAHRRPPKRRG